MSKFLEKASIPSGAKQVAEKGTESDCLKRQVWQGLKPAFLLCCSYGTTEVVPCYKTWLHQSFSAACKARVDIAGIMYG
jgi:hypothetical protein